MAPKRSSTGGSAGSNKSGSAEPQNRLNTSFKATSGKVGAKKAAPVSNTVKRDAEGPALVLGDSQWDGIHKKARKEMGGKPAIHGEVNNVNRIDDVLRVFDLTYKYGPYTGMTRLERWNRAEELGLDPPVEVKNILLTREGLSDPRYAESFATGSV